MSFSSSVKDELLQVELEQDCCSKAMGYGMLLFSRSFSLRSVYLKTEHEGVARRYRQVMEETLPDRAEFAASESGVYTVSLPKSADRRALLLQYGHTGKEVALYINRANFEDECCMAAFLRGIFLVCGVMTQPERDYHLEFSVAYKGLMQDLCKLLDELDMPPKIINRKGYYILYFKESERIEDMLTLMGGIKSALEIMNVKIYKNFRNKVNRVINCETANISKTVNASALQMEAIDILIEKGMLDSLRSDLKEVALLRKEYPEMSLRELGEQLSTPLTRSAVNHRLQKLMELAKG